MRLYGNLKEKPMFCCCTSQSYDDEEIPVFSLFWLYFKAEVIEKVNLPFSEMSELYKVTKNISVYRNKIQIQLNAIQHHNRQFQCMWTKLVRLNWRQSYVMENVKDNLKCRYCYWCCFCSVLFCFSSLRSCSPVYIWEHCNQWKNISVSQIEKTLLGEAVDQNFWDLAPLLDFYIFRFFLIILESEEGIISEWLYIYLPQWKQNNIPIALIWRSGLKFFRLSLQNWPLLKCCFLPCFAQ